MTIRRMFAPIMVTTAMLFTVLAGCQTKKNGNDFDNTETRRKTVLTLATFGLEREMRDAVLEFNSINTEYAIEIAEYEDVSLLTLDLTTGNAPDILHITMFLPYADYVSGGLFEDLYPYIDADPLLSRDDFVPAALRAAEIDGCLFSIFPGFYIYTLFGHPSVVGLAQGWRIDEFEAALDRQPQADIPFGVWETKTSFLMNTIRANIDDYINMETGTTRFDTPEFVRLLDLSGRFSNDYRSYRDTDENLISAGRQIAVPGSISSVSELLGYKTMFGGDVVIKGWMSNTNNNHELRTDDNSLAIVKTSPNKAAAWSFLRAVLDKDWQLENVLQFPSNKEAFDQKLRLEMNRYYEIKGNVTTVYDYEPTGGERIDGEVMQITDDDADAIRVLINSATARHGIDETLANIIREEISYFAEGKSNAEEAARLLQDRVSIYISERS